MGALQITPVMPRSRDAEKPRSCIVCFVFMDCIEIIVYHTVN